MIKSLKFSHKILLAASLVVFAAFALFTLYNDYLQRNAIREDLESYLREMGDVTSSNIQNWLGGRLLLVEQTAQTLARDHSPETVSALLEQPALTSTFSFTYLGQQDGVFTMRPDSPMPAGYDPRSRPWYKDAVAAGGLTLTEPYVDAATQELIITAATPVKAAGNTLGVVGGDLSLKTLVQIINSLDFSGMGYAFLVSGDGKILVHPDKEQVMKTLSEVYPQNTPKIATGFSEAELHGHTRILAFTPIKGLPSVTWYLALSIDKDKAYAMLSKFRVSAIAAALIKRVVAHPFGVITLSVVLAGAVGNLIDRALFGFVTDMFNLQFMHFAVFNVADICVVCGGIAFCVYFLFFYDKLEKKEAPDDSHPAEG